eukprot:11377268-Prorocentrum_lima.AAC.1
MCCLCVLLATHRLLPRVRRTPEAPVGFPRQANGARRGHGGRFEGPLRPTRPALCTPRPAAREVKVG